jgi:hypothetical protein
MSSNLPEECLSDLCAVLRDVKPRQVMIVTLDPDHLRSLLEQQLQDSELVFKAADTLSADIRHLPLYDAVVLHGVVEQLEKPLAQTIIGALRDLHARHLFILVPIGDQWLQQESHWQQSDLLALGMSVFRTYHVEDAVLQWYRFELESYKATPDWLNSKYWANPELFGKFRW